MENFSTSARVFVLLSLVVFGLPQAPTAAQNRMGKGAKSRDASRKPLSLSEQLAASRAKVIQLEAALALDHQGTPVSPGGTASTRGGAPMAGMQGMSTTGGMKTAKNASASTQPAGSMKKGMAMKPTGAMKMGMGTKPAGAMEMGRGTKPARGMKMAMGMMGRAPKMAGMAMPSALPGFPGASHIYHVGATGFFLDHGEHIALTQDQQETINGIKEQALLKQATTARQIEEAEQELWTLTSSDEPASGKIATQIRKITKLMGDRRIAFIAAVGEAAMVLTDDQRKALVGQSQ